MPSHPGQISSVIPVGQFHGNRPHTFCKSHLWFRFSRSRPLGQRPLLQLWKELTHGRMRRGLSQTIGGSCKNIAIRYQCVSMRADYSIWCLKHVVFFDLGTSLKALRGFSTSSIPSHFHVCRLKVIGVVNNRRYSPCNCRRIY